MGYMNLKVGKRESGVWQYCFCSKPLFRASVQTKLQTNATQLQTNVTQLQTNATQAADKCDASCRQMRRKLQTNATQAADKCDASSRQMRRKLQTNATLLPRTGPKQTLATKSSLLQVQTLFPQPSSSRSPCHHLC